MLVFGCIAAFLVLYRVYASVLRDWTRVDPTVILGAGFEPLRLL